ALAIRPIEKATHRRRRAMAIAMIEDPRATLYRRKLADLLRGPSCRWVSFSIGTAPIHRNFFESVAVALEGVPMREIQYRSGIAHRQVQYAVRLRIAACDEASYDAKRDLMIVPADETFDTIDGRSTLVEACVHLGLDLEARNYNWLDSECAARIARQL